MFTVNYKSTTNQKPKTKNINQKPPTIKLVCLFSFFLRCRLVVESADCKKNRMKLNIYKKNQSFLKRLVIIVFLATD
ncbi:hypothetical protein BKM63_15835 [Flavobacterium johnsoniae]|uniref:Uncharacterized protein n=1 Tax=Flavobacterium johnsoniae TaxID=986 RepID=A0A1J7BR30_FLAJO|nr:hypothetical protein BKM63_15835 [Flavobacterium johnsoniae]